MISRLTFAALACTALLLPACTSESEEPADTPPVPATLPADAGATLPADAGAGLPADMADIPDEVTSHLDNTNAPGAIAAAYAADVETVAAANAANVETVALRFNVKGMHCDGCATGLTDMLTKIRGVVECDVSYEGSSAVVKVTDPALAAEILETIEEATYTGELVEG